LLRIVVAAEPSSSRGGRSTVVEAALAALCGCWLAGTAAASGANLPLRYQFNLRQPATHLVGMVMDIPAAPAGAEIQFPAWNCLYQIRDFVRDVQHLTATCDGRSESLRRIDLDTWASPLACKDLELRYAVYANREGPFSAALTPEHAFLNPALLCFYPPQDRSRPVRVSFLLPAGWKLATLLHAGPGPGEYKARNYDELADSPAEAGHFQQYDYRQRGALYRVIVRADRSDYSSKTLIAALKKITSAETGMMRDVPFKRYTFIFDFPHAALGGGMEHRNGTAITVPATQTRQTLQGVEAIAAHEFFHLWNVKRIRPARLEPIDYVHGNDTRDLWFSEGVTSTYGELTLLRAGLIKRRQFYGHIARAIGRLESRPARLYQSVEASGLDAWLEKYPDYFRPARSISYYNKGELLGYLLDLGIRHGSANHASLDTLMRRLNIDFAERGRFFRERDLQNLASRLAPGFGAARFWRDDVRGVKELDYNKYLGYAGLKLMTKTVQEPALGFTALKSFEGRVIIESVESSSMASSAGLQPGDELLKMDGAPLIVTPDEELRGMKPGERVEFSVERRGQTFDVYYPLGSKSALAYEIGELAHPTPAERALRDGWLTGKTDGGRGRP
jgi:predicted metalloprotease with PDZ domain